MSTSLSVLCCGLASTFAIACGGSSRPTPIAPTATTATTATTAATAGASITMEPGQIRGNRAGSQFRMQPSHPATGPTVVDGDFGKQTIELTFVRDTKIRDCYETTLRQQPTLQGRSTATFVVAPDGKVTSASSTGLETTVDSCVADAIKTMVFPPPAAATTVTYPLAFALSDT